MCVCFCYFVFFLFFFCLFVFVKYLHLLQNHSRLIDDGVSANPLTLSRSAVLRNAGSCSCDTFTSPAYMNSKIACRCEYETSFKMIIGCFDGFSCKWKEKKNCYVSGNVFEFVISVEIIDWIFFVSDPIFCQLNCITSSSDLKYGLHADRTILCALQVCPSHANVTCYHINKKNGNSKEMHE